MGKLAKPLTINRHQWCRGGVINVGDSGRIAMMTRVGTLDILGFVCKYFHVPAYAMVDILYPSDIVGYVPRSLPRWVYANELRLAMLNDDPTIPPQLREAELTLILGYNQLAVRFV